MKEITAIIRPEKLDAVCQALAEMDHTGMSIQEVRGQGRETSPEWTLKGEKYRAAFQPKILLRIVVNDADAKRISEAIVKAAWTGQVGDGKVYLKPVEQVYRIRWGEKGEGVF